jgi:hypothetical protein
MSAGFEAPEDPAVAIKADGAADVRLFCAAAVAGPPSAPPRVSTPDAAEGAGGATKGAKIGAVAIAAGSAPSSASVFVRAVSDRAFAAKGEDEGSDPWVDAAVEAAGSSAPRSTGSTAGSRATCAAPSAAAALREGAALGGAVGLVAVRAPDCGKRSVATAAAAVSGAREADAPELEAGTRSVRSDAGGDVGESGWDVVEAALGAAPKAIPDAPASATSVAPVAGPTDVGPGGVDPALV